MTSTTPDALWSAPEVRSRRPAAVACTDLNRGDLLRRCSLSVPVGARLLLVSEPPVSASLLLRILAGVSPVRGGRIEIAGSTDPSSSGWGRRIAYVGPEAGIRSWMTPREALQLAADLLSLPPSAAARGIEDVLAWTAIPESDQHRSVRRGGVAIAQRTALACALLGDPEVLLLDDPLRALRAAERSRLLQVPGARRTVLLGSSHPPGDATLVSHVALLRQGRVTIITSMDELVESGLPLSAEGLAALADRRRARATTRQTVDARPPAAAAAR